MSELFLLLALLAIGLYVLKSREQQARIALLSRYLGNYQIERQMETLTDGYLRWLGEEDADRRTQIRGVLAGTESSLASQFERFAVEVAGMPAPQAQVSKLALWIPFAQQLLPRWRLFDVRQAFALHATGIAEVAANPRGLDAKAQAHQMTAELLLMQHTCHWFCRSKAVADARLLLKHGTPHAQVLQAVSPDTARAYRELMAGP
jgi:hypothetical protein